ncbi:hypothetical protein GCM10007916_24940 [Psychromonas marina]|uniref:B12-binding domain-containing protein n=1 Tax=Psychromonas marina TaxID=88364 RepID=A0ABQ6E2L0_9GAMM|nr:cobalamin B12-binding domain-containing protein [Psychromonas marina]GLS91425.1 hypothetical protein GCM10007916_24940 [Psychromonas marina]
MDNLKLNMILTSLSNTAIDMYAEYGEKMLLSLNHWITEEQQTCRFSTISSVDLLLNNHRNHLGFITQVIASRDADALIKALPWVYHTYHNQGVPFIYFEEELRKWKELILKTIPINEAQQLAQLYDWMLSVHEECCTVINSEMEESFIDSNNPFFQHIINGEQHLAFQYATQKVNSWAEFETFFNEEAQPCLYQVGLLWQNGTVSVSIEHLATAITNRVLIGLIMKIPPPEITKQKVLVACVESEQHQIGSWMVATALEADEWDVAFLGADTPRVALMDYIKNESPKAVIISLTMPHSIKNTQQVLKEIQTSYPDIKTVVGGQALSFFDKPETTLCADLISSNYQEVIVQLNVWLSD